MANTSTTVGIELSRDAIKVEQDGTLLIKDDVMVALVQSGLKAVNTQEAKAAPSQIQPMITITIK